MIILTAENLTKSYSDKNLFENVSFGINKTDRIGLIGVNGSGKSTLLKALASIESMDSGRITFGKRMRIAYLPQNPSFDHDMTVLDYLFAADTPTMHLLRRYERLTARLEHESHDEELLNQLHTLTAEMDRTGAWEAETYARTILSKLGITQLDMRLASLSGGQRKRVALAQTLIDPADLLILDEPTNHIDIESVAWLEEHLARFPGALLLVTHDRYFLDRVVTHIFELDQQRLYVYQGNYETFLLARAERERLADTITIKKQNLLRKEMAWLQRGARARSTKQKAHIQRIDALADHVEQLSTPRQELTIALGSRRLGKRAIELEHISKAWDDKTIISDFTYQIEPGDRIGIVGPNGAGKSTLLNLISGRLQPDQGQITIGETVHISYYDQESLSLPDDRRVLDYIQEGAHVIRLADGSKVSASAMLEWFLFTPQQQYSWISTLSGGEKRRLYLLRTLMERANILLLDEPTNDLDIQTLTVLEDFLDQFKGVVLAVSHDRYFLDRVSDFTLSFEENGTIREYPGSYSLYHRMRSEKEANKQQAKANQAEAQSQSKKKDLPRKLTWKEQQELKQIEERMMELESNLPDLEEQMVHVATNYSKLCQLQQEHDRLATELEEIMERWLELSEIAENNQ